MKKRFNDRTIYPSIISARLTREDKKQIEILCHKKGQTKSEYFRDLLTHKLYKHE